MPHTLLLNFAYFLAFVATNYPWLNFAYFVTIFATEISLLKDAYLVARALKNIFMGPLFSESANYHEF